MKPLHLLLAVAVLPTAAHAQNLGAYSGTVTVSGAEIEKHRRIDFKATMKVSIPVTKRTADQIEGEAGDLKPSATATVTQLDLDERNAGPDSDGKITSWKCKLAAPTEVPLMAQGNLDVDLRKKQYAMFVALVGTKPVPLNCVNSRSGPYKTTRAVGYFFGTSEPDMMGTNAQPFTDATKLVAKMKLVPKSAMKDRYGPVDMEWQLSLGS